MTGTTDQPRVLVVIPTLGRRLDYLRQTLQSIRSQSEPAQIVVVLPENAIEARALASKMSVTVVDDPGSMASAINLGVQRASPSIRYVNWIGDDDLLAPESLRATVDVLDSRPEAVAAFGYCDYIDPAGAKLWTSRAGRIAPWLMTWGPDLVPQPGMLIRLSAWRKTHGLQDALHYALDLDLLLSLRKQGPFARIPATLASFRWHPDSLTVSNRTASLDESLAVKAHHATSGQRVFIQLLDPLVRFATRLAAERLNKRATHATATSN